MCIRDSTCCWTTDITPLEVCTYVVVMGEGAQGANIEFIAHAELWDTTGIGACPANPNAMICSGSTIRYILPDPPDATNWLFGPLCFPLDGCSNLTHPITDDHFAVVVFDSTGDGAGDDVHMVVDPFVDACYDWVNVGGGWEPFDNYTADYTFTMFARYECTGMDVPVEMSSLSAVAIPGAVDLRWRTESEDENLGFNVFRGVDAIDRIQINADMIPGHGTTMFPNDYSFTDNDVSAGNRYSYWVSDLDYSGLETFHGPVSVLIPQETPSELALSSAGWNGSEMNLALSLPSEGETMLAVYNIAGREIATLVDQVLPAGQAMVTWDGSSSSGGAAASGTYVIRLVHESGVANVKAVISR